ncbi:MAG TPA: hypothetical protein VKY42_08195 [Trueperaceae bacterium]|nr:hypothetical protein [Trueperaceae bacterium]
MADLRLPRHAVALAAANMETEGGGYGMDDGAHREEVRRVHVEPEDRLAFRVGVNILTLALLALAGYLVWRNFLQ